MFDSLKIYIIYALAGILIFTTGYAYFKSKQVESRDMTINSQKVKLAQNEAEIAAQQATISEYKANIERARQHEARVKVIEKKAAQAIQSIKNIKVTRELTNEEIIPAAGITDLFNGMQPSDSAASGTVLPGPDKASTATGQDGSGTVK